MMRHLWLLMRTFILNFIFILLILTIWSRSYSYPLRSIFNNFNSIFSRRIRIPWRVFRCILIVHLLDMILMTTSLKAGLAWMNIVRLCCTILDIITEIWFIVAVWRISCYMWLLIFVHAVMLIFFKCCLRCVLRKFSPCKSALFFRC